MRKAVISGLVAALLVSCGTAPAKRYFQIAMPETAARSASALGRPVCVEPPTVDDVYDRFRIVYRVSPSEIEYYPYEFWAGRPGAVVSAAMVDYLRRSGASGAAAECPEGGSADIVLRSRIRVLEEVDIGPVWQAHLAMDLTFVDGKTGEKLAARSFNTSEPMRAKRVGELPAALAAILARELGAALTDLEAALKKGTSY